MIPGEDGQDSTLELAPKKTTVVFTMTESDGGQQYTVSYDTRYKLLQESRVAL
ncbi:MAG: hypothetical protein LBI43_04020 [Streptococcaceae bacterium]|nr:hypothetical protein [Streptococcaceae bacterium]